MAHLHQHRNPLSSSPPHPYQHPYFPEKHAYLHSKNHNNPSRQNVLRNTITNPKDQKRVEVISKSSEYKGLDEPKDKVKAITADLAKLKIQLNSIIQDAQERQSYFECKKADRNANRSDPKGYESPYNKVKAFNLGTKQQ